MDWRLDYSLNRDGISMHTFLDKTRGLSPGIMVVQDTQGWKFGGFTNEAWKDSTAFYGTGENFVYTFRNENIP